MFKKNIFNFEIAKKLQYRSLFKLDISGNLNYKEFEDSLQIRYNGAKLKNQLRQ